MVERPEQYVHGSRQAGDHLPSQLLQCAAVDLMRVAFAHLTKQFFLTSDGETRRIHYFSVELEVPPWMPPGCRLGVSCVPPGCLLSQLQIQVV